MAAQQPGLLDNDAITPQNFVEADIGDVLAMEDRNDFTQEWPGRRVFIMLQDECVYVFDEIGNAIHEPESFVAHGRQRAAKIVAFRES